MAGGIEDTIVSQIEENTGESFDDHSDDTADVGVEQPGRDDDVASRNVQDQLQRRTRQQDGDNLRTERRSPRERKEAQRQGRPDGKGNIVDEQGNVIATGGLARRLHVRAERLEALTKSQEERIGTLTRQLAEAKVLNGAPQEYGLNNDDVRDGLYLTALFKQNPAQAAREVLERALASGVNLHQIINDEAIPNVSIGAVNRLLEQRLGPVLGNLNEQQAVNQTQRDAVEKTNRFLAEYPDAANHEDVVAEQMKVITDEYRAKGVKPDPYIVAEQAFARVLQFCEQHRFDIRQPLEPQIRARMQQQQAGSQPGRRPVNARRPMPNGRGGGEALASRQRSASPDERYDSIVKQAMRESGIDI